MFEQELRAGSFQFWDFTYLSYLSVMAVNYIHQGGPSAGRESQHNIPPRSLKQKMNGFVYIFSFGKALKKWYFLGIYPKSVGPPPPRYIKE